MKGVRVDASVWVNPFRQGNDALVAPLDLDLLGRRCRCSSGVMACGHYPGCSSYERRSILGLVEQMTEARVFQVVFDDAANLLRVVGCDGLP